MVQQRSHGFTFLGILFLTIWVGLLAGCASAPPQTTPTPSTMPANLYLIFTRSGGIAGRTSSWTIYSDGRITTDRTDRYETTAEQTRGLFNQIPLQAFIAQTIVTPEMACADCIMTTISYHNGDQVYEVSFYPEIAQPGNPALDWVAAIDKLLGQSAR